MWFGMLLTIALNPAPAGGGAVAGPARGSCVTLEQRLAIEAAIARNVERLRAEGRLIENRGASVSLNWPLRTVGQPGRRDLTAVSNFVDLNARLSQPVAGFHLW